MTWRAGRAAAGAAGFVAAAAAAAFTGYWTLFSVFAPFDDEGVMLVNLKEFISGGGLYDRIYTYYGPFYYEVFGPILAVAGVSHNHGRLLVVAIWVLAPLAAGLAALRLTGGVLLGLVAQVVAFGGLIGLISEPMHPSGLVSLLLAASLAAAAWTEGRPRLRASLLGAIAAALLLVKVNVGVFAGAAVAFALITAGGRLPARAWLRVAAGGAVVALPLALIGAARSRSSFTEVAVVVALSAALLAVAPISLEEDAPRGVPPILAAVGVGAIVVLLSVAGALATGTSAAGLVDGVLLTPLHQADFFVLYPPLPAVPEVGASLLAAAVALFAHRRGWHAAAGVVRLGFGLEVITADLWMGFRSVRFDLLLALLPLTCLVAVPPPGKGRADPLPRVYLAALAILAILQVIPVSGTQRYFATVPLVVAGVVSVADGARGLGTLLRQRPRGLPFARVAAALAAVLLVAASAEAYGLRLALIGRVWDRAPLRLAGSERLRLYPGQATEISLTARTLRARCSTFISMPGLDSFYLWAGMQPPTALNEDSWMFIYDAGTQQRIVERVRNIPGLCALTDPSIDWGQGRPVPQRPLVVFIQTEFRPVATIGHYTISVRTGSDGP